MNFTAIVSGIFAVAKAVPTVMDFINQIVEKYIEEKVDAINADMVTEDDQRAALISAIQKATTNEELIAHSVTLDQLNNGKL